jgi:hypothetical protein
MFNFSKKENTEIQMLKDRCSNMEQQITILLETIQKSSTQYENRIQELITKNNEVIKYFNSKHQDQQDKLQDQCHDFESRITTIEDELKGEILSETYTGYTLIGKNESEIPVFVYRRCSWEDFYNTLMTDLQNGTLFLDSLPQLANIHDLDIRCLVNISNLSEKGIIKWNTNQFLDKRGKITQSKIVAEVIHAFDINTVKLVHG